METINPPKRKRSYSHTLLISKGFEEKKVRHEDTLLPSERFEIPLDIEWHAEDEVDPDERVYFCAYMI